MPNLEWKCDDELNHCIYLTETEVRPEDCATVIPEDVPGAYVNETSFRAVAIGNLDRDDTLDIFTINDKFELYRVSDDVKN